MITCSAVNSSKMDAQRWKALRVALDGIGGDRANQKIALMKKQFDQIEKLVAAECVNWQIGDLQTEHRRVFTNVITLDCPPYETLFGNDHVFAQSHVMGDIAGFYKAFGVELQRTFMNVWIT